MAAYWAVYVGVGSTREVTGSLGGLAAVIWMAACSHLRVFSTSGLETSSFWLCVTVVSLGVLRQRPNWVLWGGVLGFLSRPEGALFALVGAALLPAGRARTRAVCIGTAAAVGYALWKLWYFGDLLPNTFYAKAAGDHWGQGAAYLWLHVCGYIAYAFVPVLLWGLRRDSPRFVIYAGVCSAVYLLHIWKSGGGFMAGRLLLPLVPLAAICVGRWLNQRELPVWQVMLIGLLGGIGWFPPQLSEPSGGDHGVAGIAEESVWYPEGWRQEAQRVGESIAPYFEGTDVSVAIYGAQATFAYYARFPRVIEAESGLTDPEIARLPSQRPRPGHGFKAGPEYLRSRGVDLYLDFRIRLLSAEEVSIQLGEVKGRILSYRADALETLRERGAGFGDFPSYLDQNAESFRQLPKPDRATLLQELHDYYFNHTSDPERLQLYERYAELD